MTYKFKDIVTYIAIAFGAMLLLSAVFQVLVYAVPVIFIIWAIKWIIGKIMGTVHEHKQTRSWKKSNNEFESIDSEKVNLDYYTNYKSSIVDVEYEELN
ncbi:hypothetical protein [Clostridium thermarum]|uniref:hypothetical protein n=1 Tax=Clostridium thermarum TaxID=1716543 RepID=UPI0013D3F930|nr:hypothetical protein [Clostridium thermarum]